MTFGKTKAASSILAMAVAIAGMAGAAHAQEAQTATQDATSGFGDIVVTATKRSENVAKVPISITAFSFTDDFDHCDLSLLMYICIYNTHNGMSE